jgi:hypothetical protein
MAGGARETAAAPKPDEMLYEPAMARSIQGNHSHAAELVTYMPS